MHLLRPTPGYLPVDIEAATVDAQELPELQRRNVHWPLADSGWMHMLAVGRPKSLWCPTTILISSRGMLHEIQIQLHPYLNVGVQTFPSEGRSPPALPAFRLDTIGGHSIVITHGSRFLSLSTQHALGTKMTASFLNQSNGSPAVFGCAATGVIGWMNEEQRIFVWCLE